MPRDSDFTEVVHVRLGVINTASLLVLVFKQGNVTLSVTSLQKRVFLTFDGLVTVLYLSVSIVTWF